MKNTLICALAVYSFLSLAPEASGCAKEVAGRASKRVRLWKATTPFLPQNDLILSLRPGDTVVFGDGAEFVLGSKEYGHPQKDYGASFRISEEEALWIPFLTDNPKQLHEFEAERRQMVSHGSDFAKLSLKLGEYDIPRRRVLKAGFENQYFVIPTMPKDAFSLEAFLTPGTVGPESLDARARKRAIVLLLAFFEKAAPFKQIGLEDGTRNLYYAADHGWFLREFTGYNEMVSESDLGGPICFLLSGDFTRRFFATKEGYEAALAEQRGRRFGRRPIFSPSARELFLELAVETRIARKALFRVDNQVQWDRPTDLGELFGQ